MFMEFQKEISAVANIDEPDPLQQYKDAIPAVADELKVMSRLMQTQ